MTRQPSSAALHHAILTTFVERGHAPSMTALARRFATDEATVAGALKRLADDHGVVLHPHRTEVWVAHPFANAPTPFTIRRGARSWWGTCAWCSLGAAALLDDDSEGVTITTTLGAEDEQVTLRVRGGILLDDDFVVHFPVPMRRAWDNVVYTCSVMLLFRSAEQVDAWSERHGQPRGDVRSAATVFAFAKEWYGRHLDEDWRKWTAEEAAAMFSRHGLDGDIWSLAATAERF